MSKSVLPVITPTACSNCPIHYKNEDFYICVRTGITMTDTDARSGVLNCCPLKPLPEKKEIKEHRTGGDIDNKDELEEARGWNACLEKILEDIENPNLHLSEEKE